MIKSEIKIMSRIRGKTFKTVNDMNDFLREKKVSFINVFETSKQRFLLTYKILETDIRSRIR